MFSHIFVGSDDLDRAKAFYDATFATLDIKPGKLDAANERIAWRTKTGAFFAAKPINGMPAAPANGGTIGFGMTSPEQVDAWHAAGVAHGGATCEEAPGEREGSGLYLAYLRDPDGNKLCGLHVLAK